MHIFVKSHNLQDPLVHNLVLQFSRRESRVCSWKLNKTMNPSYTNILQFYIHLWLSKTKRHLNVWLKVWLIEIYSLHFCFRNHTYTIWIIFEQWIMVCESENKFINRTTLFVVEQNRGYKGLLENTTWLFFLI